MRDETGDEALPGDATTQVTVEPEAAMPRTEDLARADRVRLRRHPRPVAPERVERVLHDRHRVELDEAGARLLVRLEVAGELLAEMGFPEGDVPAPADAAVADVRATEILDPARVVGERVRGREVDLALGRAQLGVDESEEAFEHRPLERARPRHGGGDAVLARVLVHVERVHVSQRESLLVDQARRERVLGHRPDRQDGDEAPPVVAGGADPVHDVVRERPVQLGRFVDDPDPKIGVRVRRQFAPADPPDALARRQVAEADEPRQVVGELRLGGQRSSLYGSRRRVVPLSQVRHCTNPSA